MNVNHDRRNDPKIMDTFLSDENSLVMYWEYEKGWQILNAGHLLIEEKFYRDNGILGLYHIVTEREKQSFKRFSEYLKKRIKGIGDGSRVQRCYVETAFSMKTKDDSYGDFKVSCYMKPDKDGQAECLLCRVDRLEPEESYRYQLAKIITNDKNPESFNREVQKIFSANPDRDYAFIQFDVAGFKLINQQYGEEFGDEIIEFFVNGLKFICNSEQLYVRLTADVFMILTPYRSREDIIELIEQIRELLLGYGGVDYRLVFGINYIKDKSKNLRKYGDGAAFARQSIKNNALKYYEFFEEKMKDSANSRKWVEDQMEKALANGEYVMFLQPKFSITSNEIVGAEALVRWMHPDRGMIPPMEFIPLFEKNGFVTKLDRYIWECACKCLAKWKEGTGRLVPISVNVSRKHMQDETYVDYLELLVSKYNLEKKYLQIEITETMDDSAVNKGVDVLKQHGFTLLMDDFGSGYSSLNMLKDTQFDILKIDRAFLNDFIESDRGQKIVEHTISMTKEIGLDIVAEGVETLEQAKFLSSCGCDVAQGFYYARPMPVEQFEEKYIL